MKGGLFITLEGGEGSGKTTQMKRLKLAIESKGMEVLLTREPGGSPESEKIRKLLVERDGGDWNPISECLLLFAARSMHVEKLIKPALAANKVVICDRFTDSTRAYQGYGHKVDLETIETLNRLTLGDFKPKMTFILDIPVKDGLQRALDRAEQARRAAEARQEKEREATKAAKTAANTEKPVQKLLNRTLARAGVKPTVLQDTAEAIVETVTSLKDGIRPAEAAVPPPPPPTVEDRFEQLAIDFHERMRKGYLEIAAREPARCTVVNAARPVERVTADILARIFEM
jgi:dTMP kinase